MFEVIEREVEKTEVEKVAVFTCDMCGEKVEIKKNHTFTLQNAWYKGATREWFKFHCFSKEGETILCPTCAQKVRDVIDGKVLLKTLRDTLREKLCEGERNELRLDNEALKKERDKLRSENQRLNCLIDEQQSIMVRVMDHSAKVLNTTPTTYAESCKDLKPFDRVLVRDEDSEYWTIEIFQQYTKINEAVCFFVCMTAAWDQCLPYELYKHLLNTAEKPWEG